MTTFQPGLSLILGGARSGKSAFAEGLAEQSERRKVYVATSQVFDEEMAERVALHRQQRGDGWELVEEPLALASAFTQHANSESCILVDCLTLWITNLMMAERDVAEESRDLVAALSKLDASCSILMVSNEVGQGIVPDNAMARAFRDHAGRLHQMIAKQAGNVWFVTAGLPQKLK